MAGNGVELVWEGKRKDVERVPLPFQRVEIINESRATRQAGPLMRTGRRLPPDPLFVDAAGETPWRNKLIWGDNKYVLSSLIDGDASIGLESLAGKVDLIYIDPPFDTGTDFSFRTSIGDVQIEKEATAIEDVAYRDTWGKGIDSYLQMLYDRLVLLRDLLASTGVIFVHVGPNINHLVRGLLDEIMGSEQHRNEIIWKRTFAHSDARRFGIIHDAILMYSRTDSYRFNTEFRPHDDSYLKSHYGQVDADGRSFRLVTLSAAGPGPARTFGDRTIEPPPGRHWAWSQERIDASLRSGKIIFAKTGQPNIKQYLDESRGTVVQSVWDDIPPVNPVSPELLGYATQKPLPLLNRIVTSATQEGDLVLDCFGGSGTTMAAAEKLGRRWIGCDLGRFAIHTSRKRLLGIEGCRPFEVLNLGKYERKYWQGINAGEAVYEYFQFIVKLYHAEPVVGFTSLHGRKGEAMVHVGATDAPVTFSEVRAAMEECKANGLRALDVLGWEWEMGLNNTGLLELEQQSGVATRLFHIPHEIMDKRAVAAGDVHFYEAAYVAAKPIVETGRAVRIELTDFLVAIDDYVREKVGDKVKKWSDWIDYWAVDFEYKGDIFHNQWQAYRTRKEPKLELTSDAHTYASAGKRTILVKVVDIFGNDTTALLEVEV